jgi:hypothetical protein
MKIIKNVREGMKNRELEVLRDFKKTVVSQIQDTTLVINDSKKFLLKLEKQLAEVTALIEKESK